MKKRTQTDGISPEQRITRNNQLFTNAGQSIIEKEFRSKKKGHKKTVSHPDNYFFLNLYKTTANDKRRAKASLLKNLSIPDKINYEFDKAKYGSVTQHSPLNSIKSGKFTGFKKNDIVNDKPFFPDHQRSVSHGERYNLQSRGGTSSKNKNKSFLMNTGDDWKHSKRVKNSSKTSVSRHTFLKKLRKIWKSSGKQLSMAKTTQHGAPFFTRNTPSSVAYKKSNNNRFFSYINPVYSPNQSSTANTNYLYDDAEKKIDLAKRERRKLSQGFNPDKVFDPKQIFKKIRDTNNKPKNDKMEQFMSLSLMRDPNSIMASDKLLKQKAYKMNNRGVDPKKFVEDLNTQLEDIINLVKDIRADIERNNVNNFDIVLQQLQNVLKLTTKFSPSGDCSQDTDRLCTQIRAEIEQTFQSQTAKISLYHAKESVMVQTEEKEIKSNETEVIKKIDRIKSFARDLQEKGPKAEFKLHDFFVNMKERGIKFDESTYGPEKQKLTKTYVDQVQKQIVFDEVLKIIEDEGINIEGLFLAAFERQNEAHIQTEEQNQSSNSKTHETLDSQQSDVHLVDYSAELGDSVIKNQGELGFSKNHSGSHGQLDKAFLEKHNLKLDLNQLEENKNIDNKGGDRPQGFHQEFMSNQNNFSLSWRNQALKELEKFGAKPEDQEFAKFEKSYKNSDKP